MKRILFFLLVSCSSSSHTGLVAAGAAGGGAGAAGATGSAGAGTGGGTPGDANPDADGGPDVATDGSPDVATGGGGGSAGAAGASDASSTQSDATDAQGSCEIALAASESLPTTFPWDTFNWIETTGVSIYCPSGCGTCQVTWGTPVVQATQLLVPFSATCNVSGTFSNCAGGTGCVKTPCGLSASGDGVATLPVSGGGPWTVHDAAAGASWTGGTCRGGTSGYAVIPVVQAALEAALNGTALDCGD